MQILEGGRISTTPTSFPAKLEKWPWRAASLAFPSTAGPSVLLVLGSPWAVRLPSLSTHCKGSGGARQACHYVLPREGYAEDTLGGAPGVQQAPPPHTHAQGFRRGRKGGGSPNSFIKALLRPVPSKRSKVPPGGSREQEA